MYTYILYIERERDPLLSFVLFLSPSELVLASGIQWEQQNDCASEKNLLKPFWLGNWRKNACVISHIYGDQSNV